MKRIAVLMALVLLVGACGRGPSASSGFEVLPLEGTVEILQEGAWKPVSERTALVRGDQVRAGPDGKARIHLPGDQTVELAQNAKVLVTGAEAAEVLGGSVLAQARQGLVVAADGLEVTAADAVFRLDLGLSRRLAVYRGEAEVPRSGWDDPVTAFQQLTLVGRSAPRAPVPLEVDTNDRWDVRLLGEAMDVGLALDQQETGLAGQLRDQAARKTVIDALSRSLPGEKLRSFLSELPPALVVVAATIALTVEGEAPTDVLLEQILRLRELGASWIVVAGLWDVSRSVVSTLEEIVSSIVTQVNPQIAGQVPFVSSGGVDVGTIGGLGSGGGSGGSGGGGSGGGGSGGGGGNPPNTGNPDGSPPAAGGGTPGGGEPTPTPDPSPSEQPSPSPSPDPSPSPTCSDPVSCAIQGVIGDVAPTPSPSPSPEPSPSPSPP